MSNDGRARENGYRAFISYSHRDDAAAKSLHKRLETYRLPKKLIGQSGERGPITERLTPIFRDLDELSAADDLTVEIKAALARSATLIVLCSPGAKASKWVNLEIETFRALHGNTRPVLAALIEGEPTDAFPPALIADGQEPVAADFRKNRDGKSLALLKLVAGMAGAPLDALVQRDAQRQYRRVMAITGGALTAALAMALLLVVALRAQSEAERQRQEAEGLVEYMLTDLRDKLKGVGRLDVMTAVNERAMKYYGGQEALEGLPAESLERRARILHAMGEDDEKRGNVALAVRKFEEAHRVTAVILAKNPNDPERIFAHAQSEFWVGEAAWRQNDRVKTTKYWQGYLNQAKKLAQVEPASIRSEMELGYSYGNLCDLYSKDKFNLKKSRENCEIAIFHENRALKLSPNDPSIIADLANRYGWLATVHIEEGNPSLAIIERNKEALLVQRLLKIDPKNFFYQNRSLWPQIGIATALINLNQDKGAEKILLLIMEKYNIMVNNAPDDISIREYQLRTLILLSSAQRSFNRKLAVKNLKIATSLIDDIRTNKTTHLNFVESFEKKITKLSKEMENDKY